MNTAEQVTQTIAAVCEFFHSVKTRIPIVQSAFEHIVNFYDAWRDRDEPPLKRDDIIALLVQANDWLSVEDFSDLRFRCP